MVKNIQGGSKTKSQARKVTNAYASRSKLRLSSGTDEIYACVTKLNGGGKILIMTVDDKKLLCRIPGKFSGRSKRNNLLQVGSIILAGIHEWTGPCEILEIYDDDHHHQLRSIPSARIHLLDKYIVGNDDVITTDFTFSENDTESLLPLGEMSQDIIDDI